MTTEDVRPPAPTRSDRDASESELRERAAEVLRRFHFWQPVVDDTAVPVTPSDVARAWRGLAQAQTDDVDSASRTALEQEFRRRLARFAHASPVKRQFLCSSFLGGCFLTETRLGKSVVHKLWFVLDTDSVALARLQQRAASLHDDVVQCFGGQRRPSSQLTKLSEAIFEASTWVLYATDVYARSPEDRNVGIQGTRMQYEIAEERIDKIERIVTTQIRRQSRFRYIGGALIGLGVVLVLSLVLGLFSTVGSATPPGSVALLGQHLPGALAAGLAFGAIGALASVSQRLLHGSIDLDFRASRRQHQIIGAVRPVFGGLVGLFVALALASGLLGPLGTANATIPALATLAFLSGFSERYATETLDGAERSLAPGSNALGGGAARRPDAGGPASGEPA